MIWIMAWFWKRVIVDRVLGALFMAASFAVGVVWALVHGVTWTKTK